MPPPKLTVSQWADQHRKLSSESSPEPGNWHTSLAPYQREIMDAASDRQIETVVVMSSAQVGKTEVINNVVGYHIHQDPAPMMVVQPTEKLAETWSTDRLAPMLRDSAVFKGLVKEPRSRDSGNKILYKKFPGGQIVMAGSNAPSSLASRPVRIVLCDEVDRYPASAGTEGDPVNLARKRATNFWNRKIILTSTPTIKGLSRIEAAYLQSDQRRYYVPCPQCGEYQTLKWARVEWPKGEPLKAVYVCEESGCIIHDHDKPWMLKEGTWIAEAEFTDTAGFHLSELYSPWVTWGRMAAEFLKAKLLPETLKTWINTALGETWEEAGEGVDHDSLLNRKENWGEKTPDDVLVITAGVDVQDDRLEIELVGWGIGEESWSLDYIVLHGDPAGTELWNDLDDVLGAWLLHESGIKLHVACTCIDSGGHHTQAVYAYCKKRQIKRIFAVKGSSIPGKALLSRPSISNRMRVKLFSIGTDTAKEMIYSRLKITEPGRGYCHFPAERDAEYFKQLTAEKIVTHYSKGFPVRKWEKQSGQRNEALDVRVYALAALYILGANLDRLAQRRKTKSESTEPDKDKETAPAAARKKPRKRNSFVKSW